MEHPWADERLSRAFIQKTLLDWSGAKYAGSTAEIFADALLSAAHADVHELEVWLPVAHLEVEAPFDFGPVTIAPITAQMVNQLEELALAPKPEQAEKIAGLFQRVREELQGLAAVVIRLECEQGIAEERALLLGRDVVDLLRFFSPGARFLWMLCPTALLGAEHLSGSKVMILRDGGFSSMTEKASVSRVARWRMSLAELTHLQQLGLPLAGTLVMADGLDDFERSVRLSLITFSKGATLVDPVDRLNHALTAMEGVLLKHSMEPIEFNVADRMSFLLSQDAGQREDIRQNIRHAYRLRMHHRAAVLAPREFEALAVFLEHAYWVLLDALRNIQIFRTRVDFVAAVDRLGDSPAMQAEAGGEERSARGH